jgi:hypothetical protein
MPDRAVAEFTAVLILTPYQNIRPADDAEFLGGGLIMVKSIKSQTAFL